MQKSEESLGERFHPGRGEKYKRNKMCTSYKGGSPKRLPPETCHWEKM